MKPYEQGEPAGDPTTPDNTPAHENAEPASMEQQEGSEEDSPNVSPDEQAAYDTVVKAALSMIYVEDGSFSAIVEKIKGEADKNGLAYGIGHTAAMILRSITEGAKQQGREVPEDVLLPAGQEVVAELVEVAVKAGLASEADQEKLFSEAVMNGVQEYGKAAMNAGEVTPDQQAQAKSEFDALKNAPTQQPGSLVAAAKGA